jgi:hypothetical protein
VFVISPTKQKFDRVLRAVELLQGNMYSRGLLASICSFIPSRPMRYRQRPPGVIFSSANTNSCGALHLPPHVDNHLVEIDVVFSEPENLALP